MKTTLKTPLAVLRNALGMKPNALADIIGMSASLITKVEVGQRTLTPERAAEIERATGCTAAWLLAGDASAPMLGYDGQPYTLRTFEDFRARRGMAGPFVAINPCALLPELAAGAEAAAQAGRLATFAVKVRGMLDALRGEFGTVPEAASGAVAAMSKTPKAFAWDVCDDAIAASAPARVRRAVDALAAGSPPPFCTTMRASVRRGERKADTPPARQARRKAGKTGKKPAKARK